MNFNDMLMFLGRLVVGLTLKIDRATHSIPMHKDILNVNIV